MMGRSHAATGWCAGLALSAVADRPALPVVVLMACATAGFALLPDLDHRSSTASRLLGPFTRLVSWLLRRTSSAVYEWSRAPGDRRRDGEHRHLAHTALFAVGLGLAVTALVAVGGPPVAVAVLGFGVLLAAAALGAWVLGVVAAALALAVLAGGAVLVPVDSGRTALVVGGLVAVGCLVHDLGDMVTHSGVPLLWPLRVHGQAWYRVRPPAALRFRAGGPFESLLVFPALVVAGALLLFGAVSSGSTG
ncbi:metal-dependent hydrolase [Streptoalloteichus hindustanus]|uniref:LexA-binding, inner membrane-associated putative hydrolase n=1 Tax=Streptoalloteichus hindustanus TaxID=2017 RepID=A0A1M5EJG1_STRHI|nr:metal-dependent hydrolase [Streptoalloteichus hindustanus]SHF79211.1 LexA-binding, inner membrane-associated putative hydrolase [Streptoalloteichus hindustanus]